MNGSAFGLQLRRMAGNRPSYRPTRSAQSRRWSMDFMADRLGDGRAFRLLNGITPAMKLKMAA